MICLTSGDNHQQSGYREGITAGKEGALQEGFDDGFATVGVPLGERVGTLRGIAAGVIAVLRLKDALTTNPSLFAEAQAIARGLDQIRYSDIVPPDRLAEEHNKLHEDEAVTIRASEPNQSDEMDDISAAFSTLATKDSAVTKERRRQEALTELQKLQERLEGTLHELGVTLSL